MPRENIVPPGIGFELAETYGYFPKPMSKGDLLNGFRTVALRFYDNSVVDVGRVSQGLFGKECI